MQINTLFVSRAACLDGSGGTAHAWGNPVPSEPPEPCWIKRKSAGFTDVPGLSFQPIIRWPVLQEITQCDSEKSGYGSGITNIGRCLGSLSDFLELLVRYSRSRSYVGYRNLRCFHCFQKSRAKRYRHGFCLLSIVSVAW